MNLSLRIFIGSLIVSILCCQAALAQQVTITSVTPTPVCAGAAITATYSYTLPDPGTVVLYLNGPNTTNVPIGTATTSGNNGSVIGVIPADRATGSYTVYIRRTSNILPTPINSPNSNAFTVNALPAAPTVSNLAYCLGSTGVPPLTATGQNLKWYSVSTGGTASSTAPTPPTSTAGTTNYYVSQTSAAGCEGPRATLAVTINPLPAKPTVVSSLSYCQNSSAPSLAGAVTSGSNLKWYTSLTGGSGTTIAPTPQTTVVNTTTYYVSQTDGNGCESARADITVTIKANPTAPTVTTPVTYCQGQPATPLSATPVNGATLNWFGPSGNALGSTAPTPPTTSPGTTFYSVSQTFGGCSSPAAPITVVVNAKPAAPTTKPVGVCQNTTPVSLATGVTSGTNLRWYTTASGGTASTVAPAPPTTTIGSTTYYVSQINSNGCESDRSVITYTVNAYPAAPTVSASPLTYCQSSTAVPLTATPVASATLTYYTVASGGTAYASLTPSTSSSNNYYVSQTLNGCEGPRATINVVINALPARPAVTTPVAYCQFTVAAPLSATASTNNTLSWYGTNATGGTASTVVPTPSTTTDGAFTYYVSQKDPFGCESERAPISVTVYPKPTAPVTTPASACLNSVPAPLTQSVTASGTLKWYTTSTGGTGSTVAPTLSTTAVGATTYYVSQTNPSGCESDRSAITFTVNPLPAAPVPTPTSLLYCQNAPAQPLTATGQNLKWYSAASGGTLLGSSVTPSTSLASSITYYVSQTDANGCESPRASVTVTTTSRPVAPTVSAVPVTYCQFATAAPLSATPITGNTLNWYGPAATGGTASATATVPATDPAGTNPYYVSQTDGNGCESSSRASITVIVNPKPTAPTVNSVTLCQNAPTVALATAVTSGTNLKWYTVQNGGTGSAVAPTLSTSAVGSTTYYVSQTSAEGCESDRIAIPVTVKPLPAAPTITQNTQNLCQSSVPTPLTAIATGTLTWYSPNGQITSSVTPSTNAVGPTSYSVTQTVDGCEGPKATLNVVVIPKPVAPTVTSSLTICQAAPTITLSATATSGNTLLWYTNPTGGASSATAPTPPTSDSGTTSYYVTQTDANGCESDRASISFTVKRKPAAPGTAPVSFCSNQVTPLTATFEAGTIPNWYGTNSAGTPKTTPSTPSTAVIGQAVPYYVSQTLNGCESAQAFIDVTIKALPVAPAVSSTPVTYCQDATAAPLSATAASGGSLIWYYTQTGGVASPTAITPQTNSSLPPTTYYYVSQTVNGCEGPRATLAVTINPKPAKPTVTSSFTYCQNTAAPALTATGTGTLKWYSDATTTTTIPTPTPSTATAGPPVTYYVSQTDGNGCESDRASITVTIIATPAAPGVASLSLCQKQSTVPLTATPDNGGTLSWYTSFTGGTGSSLAPTPVTSATGTVTYYVSQRVSGCEGPRASLDVTVKPLPTAPTVDPTPIRYCQSAVATPLSATASTGGTLNWYVLQGGVESSLGQATPTPSTTIAGPITYYVSQSVNGCEGPRATLTVTVSQRLPKPTVVSSLTYCQSTTTTAQPLTATGTGTLKWYSDQNTTTTIPTPTPSIATAGTPVTYYVSQTDANGCESERASITVNIIATPSLPGVSSLSVCQNATAPTLTASFSPGGSLNWYGTNVTGGTASPFPPVPPTNTVGTTSYYVSQSVSGCEGPRTNLDVTIKPLPAAPTVTNSTPAFCQNSVATALSATPSNGGTLNWYTVPIGGVASPSAPIPPTNAVGPIPYYVSQSVIGCEGPQATITVTIKALPAAPTVSASSVTFCQGTAATALTAGVVPGGTLKWYTVPTDGTSSPFAPVPPTATPDIITYYVSQSVNDCESPRVPIVVIIKATPSAPIVGATAPIYCQGGTATALSAVAPDGGALTWYTTPTGGTPSPIPPVPPVNNVGPVTYYVSQNLNGCEGPRVPLTATIQAAPAAPFATPSVAYCQGATAVALTATPTGSNLLNWYTTPTGGSASSAAPVPPTSSAGSTQFYVSQTDAIGCESVRSAVTVKINALPVVPSTVPVTYCQGGPTTALTATLTGGVSLNWYTAAAGGVASPVAPTPVSTNPGSTPYYVSQTDANGCESNRNVVLVTVTPAPVAPVVAAIAPVCQNSPAFAVQAAGQNLKWYTDPTSTVSLGSSVLQSTALPGTYVYYVSQTVNTCEGARAQAQVVVNPLPVAPIVANVTGCQDAVVQPLTASGTALQWYDSNDNQIAAPTPLTKVDLPQTYTYKVTQTLNGCESPKATFTYTVNITPLPTVTPVVAFCQNSLATPLQATGTNLKWTDPTGVVSANAPTPTTLAVTAGSSYSVTQTSALGCESRPAEIKVAVNAQAVAKLEGNASVYLGSPALLTLTLTGAGPYSYTLSDGTSGIAESSATSPVTTKQVSVTPAATTTYTIAAVSNACGVGPSSGAGTVTVKVPTVTTSALSASSVCAGTSFTVPFSSTGEFATGNAFTVEIANTVGDSASRKFIPISNGVVQGPFITTTIPTTIAPGQYYVRVVASNAPYSIRGTLSPTVLTVRPSATAGFTASKQAIYKGESVILVFNLGGDGPWTGTYAAGPEIRAFGTTTSVYSATLTPTVTTTYKLLSVANGCGAGKIEGADTTTVRVDILLAEEDLLSSSVKVYPVPTDGAVTIDIDLPLQSKPAQIRLVSPSGLITEQITTKKRQTVLDINKEPAGTYLLYITVGDRSTVRKILKW
ncbi:Ig-like domain-containing protein [Spirosoma radiotolerans]|uniref:Ig-like domain-containing protein n=1 Tax=Spirosoma radiotolerans TaxID=1379870 RepID=A0A0E3ZX02_9BACT|nr:T9SS type A sorting domain-containing protein [Spirosoma radiotolerans]AKD56084.1 hypothetical protein SD10_15460 [Spirosoma radiotolerans]